MSATFFDIAAESARRERDRIARKVDLVQTAMRAIPVIDETERWMHDVHGALRIFERAIESTESPSRLRQLEERAGAFAEMWASVQEKARDKQGES